MSPPISPRPSLSAVVALLSAARLPTEDLTDGHCENFFFSGSSETPGGLVGLELYGAVALLRSLVVSEEQRGTGAGSRLLSHAEQHARSRGVRHLYLLTTTAEGFFFKRGFICEDRQAAPSAIRATREFADL